MPEKIIFHSFDEYKQYYFPKEWAKIQEEQAIKEAGSFGAYLANKCLEELRKTIKDSYKK